MPRYEIILLAIMRGVCHAVVVMAALFVLAGKPALPGNRGISTRIENGGIILQIDDDDFRIDSECARRLADALRDSADELECLED